MQNMFTTLRAAALGRFVTIFNPFFRWSGQMLNDTGGMV